MRPKSILLLGLALGCGLIASIGISQVMERNKTQIKAPETEPILVALNDINLAEPLSADVLKLEEWPKDKIAPDAIRKLDDVVGRRTRTKIYAGEPIREAKLISADGSDAPSEQIAKGYRVVAVRVDAATGVAGLVKPGDRVDVQLFVQKNPRTGIAQSKVKTILEDVKIFAVDSSFRRATEEGENDQQVARTISLLVTPKQAETLNLANELGKIRLTIRHPDDDTNVTARETTSADLFVGSKATRDQETASVKDDEQEGGLKNFLKNMQPQPTEPVEVAAAPPAAPPANFIMQIFEGADGREVEFSQAGRLPQAVGAVTSGGYSPDVQPTPAAPAAAPAPTAPVESDHQLEDVSDELESLGDFDLGGNT